MYCLLVLLSRILIAIVKAKTSLSFIGFLLSDDEIRAIIPCFVIDSCSFPLVLRRFNTCCFCDCVCFVRFVLIDDKLESKHLHDTNQKMTPLCRAIWCWSQSSTYWSMHTRHSCVCMQIYVVSGTANDGRNLHKAFQCHLRYLKYHIKVVLNLNLHRLGFYFIYKSEQSTNNIAIT